MGIRPFARIDWVQHRLNEGIPCFHVEHGRFCGRSTLWEGHNSIHRFIPLHQAVEKAVKEAVAKAYEEAAVEMARSLCGINPHTVRPCIDNIQEDSHMCPICRKAAAIRARAEKGEG